ncbi:MAG: DUF3500 domain-containing protein [Caldilineaceae bacterium]
MSPTGSYQRAGLRMGDLSEEQQAAVYAVVEATLSPEGYQRVLERVTGDEVLKNEGGSAI